jgi:hypothetical protein
MRAIRRHSTQEGPHFSINALVQDAVFRHREEERVLMARRTLSAYTQAG